MSDESKIPDAVINLRDAMAEHATAKEALSKRLAKFTESIETEASWVRTLAAEIENLKNTIGPLAIAEFKETGHKKMWGGVGVRETTSVNWDHDKALAFAKEKDMFLILDDATFKKAAPTLGLDFVTVTTEPRATFPKEFKL